MKKNCFYIFLFLLLSIYGNGEAFAVDCSKSCKIKETTAPILEEYIKNQRLVIKNIGASLRTYKKTPLSKDDAALKEGASVLVGGDDNLEYMQKLSIRSWNVLTNWNDFGWRSFVSTTQFVGLSILGEFSAIVHRDLNRLTEENKLLNNFLRSSIIANYSKDSQISNACDGVAYCKLEGGYYDIIEKLIHNNNKLIEYYRLSILGKHETFPEYNFLLTHTTFKAQFNNYYNKYTISDCRTCEGGFWDKVGSENLESIFKNLKIARSGFQEWKDAADLFTGTKNAEFKIAQKEKELLKKELSRQGVATGDTSAMMRNLNEFNNSYDKGSAPSAFIGSLGVVNENLGVIAKKFNEDIYGMADALSQVKEQIERNLRGGQGEGIPLNSLLETEADIKSAIDIMQKIDTLYEKQIPFIARINNNNEKIQDKLIKMHINLSLAINILDKTIPISEKVCNDQDSGNGKCTY